MGPVVLLDECGRRELLVLEARGLDGGVDGEVEVVVEEEEKEGTEDDGECAVIGWKTLGSHEAMLFGPEAGQQIVVREDHSRRRLLVIDGTCAAVRAQVAIHGSAAARCSWQNKACLKGAEHGYCCDH